MRYTVLLFIFFTPSLFAHAYDIERIEIKREIEVISINDPLVSQLFYGTLEGVPHTYTFTLLEPAQFRAVIMMPDVTEPTILQGIIVRKAERGVTEVVRMSTDDASWEKKRRGSTGDVDRVGPSFEETLDAGTYILEISTPDNRGSRYVLEIGPPASGLGKYLISPSTLIDLKRHHDTSPLRIIEAPIVFVPILALLVGIYWYRRRKKMGTIEVST